METILMLNAGLLAVMVLAFRIREGFGEGPVSIFYPRLRPRC